VLSGDDLLPNTRVVISQRGYEVAFEFRGDKRGGFEDFTSTHTHRRLSIFLDKKLLSAPVIHDIIFPAKASLVTTSLQLVELAMEGHNFQLRLQVHLVVMLGVQAIFGRRMKG
jgi:preprotein translocase subunit SecD